MTGNQTLKKEDVIKANIELHTQLANVYNKDEPHWRPENIAVVRSRLADIQKSTNGTRMLDVGCGTGFMIEVARPLKPKYILGVDITPAMIAQVDKSGLEKVDLHIGDAGAIPSENGNFDFATAYSFIDHLYDMDGVFKEINRCLKSGGIFYAGLIPNEYFWGSINSLPRDKSYSKAINREIRHVSEKDEEINKTYGVDQAVFNTAEFQKNIVGGLSEESLTEKLNNAGFSKVKFFYDWFLGQGLLNNDPSLSKESRDQKMQIVNDYLTENLPVTRSLFKYVSFFATK